jgi:hypothetical protein
MVRLAGRLIVTFPGSTVGGGSGGRCRSGTIPPWPSPMSPASPTSMPSNAAPSHTRRSSNRVGRVLGGRQVAATSGVLRSVATLNLVCCLKYVHRRQ